MVNNNDDFRVFLPYEFVSNVHTTGFDMAMYCYLRMVAFNSLLDSVYFDAEDLSLYMIGDCSYVSEIKQELSHFPIVQSVRKNHYSVNPSAFVVNGRFVIIPISILRTIQNSEYSYKWNLLKLYAYIQTAYNLDVRDGSSRPYIADKPQAWYAAAMGVKSNLTIAKYVKALEELQIIYAHRSRKPHVNTLLGLYENRTLIAQYAGKQHNVIRTSDSNHKRSLMQKYNAMLQGKMYDPDTIAEVKAYILSYNSEQEELQRQHPDDDYLSLRKDVSVFT